MADTYIPGKNVSLSDQLVELLDPLAEQHFPVANWTVQVINESLISCRRFIDTVKMFSAIADEEVRQSLTDGAISAGFYQSADACTIREMFKWCVWLKTPEGNATIIAAEKRQFEKRALPALFNEQRAEFTQALKEKRAYYDDLIQELGSYLELAKQEKDMELHNVQVDFTPASGYKGMLIEERASDIDEYLGRGTNTTDLKVWAQNRILRLEENGETKKAGTLSQYMEAAGGPVAEVVRTMSVARTDKARRPWDAEKRPASEVGIADILAKRFHKPRPLCELDLTSILAKRFHKRSLRAMATSTQAEASSN